MGCGGQIFVNGYGARFCLGITICGKVCGKLFESWDLGRVLLGFLVLRNFGGI